MVSCLRCLCQSFFSFPEDNLCKYQWIFPKLGMCIDIMEILFGIAGRPILSIFDRVFCPHISVFSFTDVNLNMCQ